jgi:hypothetical protein
MEVLESRTLLSGAAGVGSNLSLSAAPAPVLSTLATKTVVKFSWHISVTASAGGETESFAGDVKIAPSGGSASFASSEATITVTIAGGVITLAGSGFGAREGGTGSGTGAGSGQVATTSKGYAASGPVSGTVHVILDDGSTTSVGLSGSFTATSHVPGTTTLPGARDHLDAAVQGHRSHRTRTIYNNVINQFDVEHNDRYKPYTYWKRKNGQWVKVTATYCNIFLTDVMRAMSVVLPHWVDANGKPAADHQTGAHEINLNETVDWMDKYGRDWGWRPVSAGVAQHLANLGIPAVAIWKNPTGADGHGAVIRPGVATANGDEIAQAGNKNFNDGHVSMGWLRADMPKIQYWVNDR